MEDSEIPLYRLLQPEIMCRNELIEVLKRYNLKVDISSADNSELVEIYQKLALPLPQRKYGSTHREKLLTKKQIRLNKGKKTEKTNYETMSGPTSHSPSISSTSSTKRDRLKPPLDSTNIKKKKIIKLNTSSSSSPDVPHNGDSTEDKKIDGTEVSPSDEKESLDCKRKRIKIDFSDSSANKPTPKVVNLRRPSSKELDSKEPKSKHRRIVI